MSDELNMELLGDRILIVTPHPDDETIATGGLIQRALQRKKQVRLLVATNGDGFRKAACQMSGNRSPKPQHYKLLGEKRQAELLRAVSILGLSENHVRFLGFPNGGLAHLWNEHWDTTKKYSGRTGCTECPYSLAYASHAPYSGQQLARLIESVLTQYEPTDVIFPAREDRHDDHWATQAFTQYAIAKCKIQSHQWSYLVHYPDWPNPYAYRPNHSLSLPSDYDFTSQCPWFTFTLTPTEVTAKLRALYEHKSQIEVMKEYLESFVRKNELYQSVHPELFRQSATLRGSKHEINLTYQSGIWNLTVMPYPPSDPALKFVVFLRSLSTDSEQQYVSYGMAHRIPNQILRGAHHFFLSSEVRKKGKPIDRTSWGLYCLSADDSGSVDL
ncbi:PIG-L deacetylase family protein [Effusibacillus consociatus]|uniref:PIG-L deacetylase family protein n=1 Tax=Effusibacillus consociatus TaxID=1117041 RepID=A0ABV9Q4C0_9BACL